MTLLLYACRCCNVRCTRPISTSPFLAWWVIGFGRDGPDRTVRYLCVPLLVSTTETALYRASASAREGGRGNTVRRQCARRQESVSPQEETSKLMAHWVEADRHRRFLDKLLTTTPNEYTQCAPQRVLTLLVPPFLRTATSLRGMTH